MSKSRLGPEAKIITLFAALSEDSRRIVMDILKSQSATPRKTAAKKPPASPAAQKEPTSDKEVACVYVFKGGIPCGFALDNPVHHPNGGYGDYHPFEPPKSVARAARKSSKKTVGAQPDPSSEIGMEDVGNAALAASGGD